MPRQRKRLPFDAPGQSAQVTVWNKAKTRKWELTYKVLEVKAPRRRRKGKASAETAEPAMPAKKPRTKAKTAKRKTKTATTAKKKPATKKKAKRARPAT